VNSLKPYHSFPVSVQVGQNIEYLNENQLNALTGKFQDFYDKAPGFRIARIRGRYFLVFLFLRFTAGRVSEIAGIDDQVDVDFRSGDVTLAVLKRRNPNKQNMRKMVAVPLQAVNELARYLAQYPEMKGKVFKVNRSNFFRVFQTLSIESGIPGTLAHPHVLRHTRALEMIRAGVPLTIVQQILGHSNLNTTAIYLQFSGQEAKSILKDRGLI
jgi:molybdate transport system regulatory protein